MNLKRFFNRNLVECPDCNGRGHLPAYIYAGEGRLAHTQSPCKRCNQTGYVKRDETTPRKRAHRSARQTVDDA